MKNLKGKVILVCGGATGIGAATVQRLTEEGASVGIGDLNLEAAQVVAERLRQNGADVAAWQYDQAQEDQINTLVQTAADHFGALDGLFANVADLKIIHQDGDMLSNDAEIWQRTMQVNVTGTAMLLRAALPHLLSRGAGSFVLTSSGACVVGEAERPAYAASKAAINSMCRHVATKWGRQGVRCNAVSPGFVLTEQLEQHMPQDMKDAMLRGSRSTRHGASEDIAGAVAFLMSDDGEWVNGQTWHVNGGVNYAN